MDSLSLVDTGVNVFLLPIYPSDDSVKRTIMHVLSYIFPENAMTFGSYHSEIYYFKSLFFYQGNPILLIAQPKNLESSLTPFSLKLNINPSANPSGSIVVSIIQLSLLTNSNHPGPGHHQFSTGILQYHPKRLSFCFFIL